MYFVSATVKQFRMAAMLLLVGALLAVISSQDANAYTRCLSDGHCLHKWSPAQVTWSDGTGWTGDKALAIQTSAITWNYHTDFRLVYYSGGPTQISVSRADLGLSGPPASTAHWSGSGSYLSGAHIYLNSATTYVWWTAGSFAWSDGKWYVDVRTVVTHEFGHTVSLGHDCGNHPEAVMCPDYTAKWYLTTDDLNGLDAAYP